MHDYLQDVLTQHPGLLRPGRWFLDGDWALKASWLTVLGGPRHAGQLRPEQKVGEGNAGPLWSKSLRALRRSARFARGDYPVRTVPVVSGPQGQTGSEMILGKTYVIVFDTQERYVWKIPYAGEATARHQMAMIHRLGKHLPLVGCDLVEQGTVLREQHVHGGSFARASEDVRAEVLTGLVNRYAELTAMQQAGNGIERVVDALLGCQEIAEESSQVRELQALVTECQDLSHGVPLIPSHGDLSAGNILMQAGEARVIDFDRTSFLPAFTDVVWLLLDEAFRGRPELLAAYIGDGGVGENYLEVLTGNAAPTSESDWQWLLKSALAIKTWNDISVFGPGCYAARTFGQRLRMVDDLLKEPGLRSR